MIDDTGYLDDWPERFAGGDPHDPFGGPPDEPPECASRGCLGPAARGEAYCLDCLEEAEADNDEPADDDDP